MNYLQKLSLGPYGTAEKAASCSLVGGREEKAQNGRDSSQTRKALAKRTKLWCTFMTQALVLLALFGTLLLTRMISWSPWDSLRSHQQPALSFSLKSPLNGASFQITLFADLHFGEEPSTPWGPEQDINTTRAMEAVLSHETPDLVVLLGDLITSDKMGY